MKHCLPDYVRTGRPVLSNLSRRRLIGGLGALIASAPASQLLAQGGPPPLPPGNTGGPPPLPPAGPVLSYYVSVNGQAAGPYGADELKRLVATGQLNAQTLVWTEGMGPWTPAGQVAELQPILGGGPRPQGMDAMAFMDGVWTKESQFVIQGVGPAVSKVEVTYRKNGVMSETGTITAKDNFGQPMRMILDGRGTFTADAQSDTVLMIRPNMQVQTSIPNYSIGMELVNTPFRATIVDRNTLRTDDGLLSYRIG